MVWHHLSNHPIHRIWSDAKSRCYNPNCTQYKDYGGRGIKMCYAWKEDFLEFYHWAIDNGWKKGLQIDRRDNNEGYFPWNCRFVTQTKNSNNKRTNRKLRIFGRSRSIAEWSRHRFCKIGKDPKRNERILWDRVYNHNWDHKRALITPAKNFSRR